MADVFLSYRNLPDRREIVARFATILRAYGVSVWWDYGLEAGAAYTSQIVAAIEDARVVTVFWCAESVSSKWVKREAALAGHRLLPARLQAVKPPDPFEPIHSAHLENWDGSILDPMFDQFVRAILNRLDRAYSIQADTKAQLAQLPLLSPLGKPASPKRWHRIPFGGGSFVVPGAVVVAIAGYVGIKNPAKPDAQSHRFTPANSKVSPVDEALPATASSPTPTLRKTQVDDLVPPPEKAPAVKPLPGSVFPVEVPPSIGLAKERVAGRWVTAGSSCKFALVFKVDDLTNSVVIFDGDRVERRYSIVDKSSDLYLRVQQDGGSPTLLAVTTKTLTLERQEYLKCPDPS